MEWHPIETAPKDGTPVLGYRDVDGVMATVTWIQSITYGEWAGSWGLVLLKDMASFSAHSEIDMWWPTHWMPLPDPPKKA
jgi:hypothetical protein